MRFSKPELADLKTESDVEQKFIYPLLAAEYPEGLGFSASSIQTKADIRRLTVGKGADRKLYFPDYVLTLDGMPVGVVEAKVPGADLKEAFREARLYAAELNSAFPTATNPVRFVIASDGARIVAGYADHENWSQSIAFDDVNPSSQVFNDFMSSFGLKSARAHYEVLLPRFRQQKLWKPRRLVGGTSIQREEVSLNTFGATISADFSHIFNPINHDDRVAVARDGYVSSKRRERYIEPIDRIIRAATPPSISKSRTIEDTGQPAEIIKALRNPRKLEQQILLIVGSAGAGKTTFIDHLQEVALPKDVRDKTVWVRINMNPAPISRDEIYNWLRREIVSGLMIASPSTDFYDLDVIKAVHAPDVVAFRKGIGRLYERDKLAYDMKLGEVLEGCISDLHKHALALARYLTSQTGKLLIIVLDNCDKRLRDEQLLMFEAAQWLQREFSGLVVLPLREETYDNHRDEPPLDTALKDLVFRIEPPLFQFILQSRVQMALKSITKNGGKTFHYKLPNGMDVEYPASDQAYYLSSIMRSLFEYGMHVRRLIVGLSGRNMRRALEIFLEFCTSGHIGEDEFFKIRQSKGQYVLPLSLVTTVLLRLNQRYYSSSHAFLKNLYSVDERDARVNYFTRVIILSHLQKHLATPAPTRLKGYVRAGELRKFCVGFGVEDVVFDREIEALARGYCIVTEDFRVSAIGDEELVALSPAGIVHLDMMHNVYYLAAVSEDTWFFSKDTASEIAERIKDDTKQYSPSVTFYNALALVETMTRARQREIRGFFSYKDSAPFEQATDLTKSWNAIEHYEKQIVPSAWFGARTIYAVGTKHSGLVQNVVPFGVFVDLKPGVTALMHASKLPEGFASMKMFEKGACVSVEVADLDYLGNRMSVILCTPAESTAL